MISFLFFYFPLPILQDQDNDKVKRALVSLRSLILGNCIAGGTIRYYIKRKRAEGVTSFDFTKEQTLDLLENEINSITCGSCFQRGVGINRNGNRFIFIATLFDI